MWLWLVSAFAQDTLIVLQASPGARVEDLPTHGPAWFELAIHDNRVALREQLPASARHLRDIETVSVGAGTTYLRLHADRDDLALQATAADGEVRILLSPTSREREIAPPPEPAAYAVLVGPEPPARRVRTPPVIPITPLVGDARTYRQDPRHIPLGVVPWTGAGDETLPVELQAPPDSWYAADGFRAVLTGPTGREHQTVARFLLAQTYLEQGIPHEAVYYLERTLGRRGPWEPSLPHLQMARAQLGRGDVERARAHCRKAAMRGGDELLVLRCLGAVALQDGEPPPRHLALAIEERATDGESLLLAAELMMADLDYAAARRMATSATSGLQGRTLGHARMIMGDASYFLGDPEAAAESWTVAARLGFAEVVGTRRVMAQLAKAPRRTWGRHVPYLEKLARRGEEGAIEAHYLLGQIAEVFPDPERAARHYHAVWDASAETAMASDIPERLVAMCERYAGHLEEGERWADLVVFSDVCWRDDLDHLAADTTLSERWARGYVELGLVGEALKVQRRVVRVRNELDREAVEPLLLLAELYTRSGRPREALETVAYVRERLKQDAADPRLLLREAEAHAAMGEVAAARRVWTVALGRPEVAAAARRSLGLLDAFEGRCADAVLRLSDEDASQQLAKARCALTLGRAAEAEAAAADVVVNADEAFADEGNWLLGAAAFAQRRPEQVADPTGSGALWAAVLAEEEAAAAFDATLTGP
jgi:tetratricopeptide (TPR) repeat protein